MCLEAVFLARTGERQRLLGEGLRLLKTTSQPLRLPQRETTVRLRPYHTHAHSLLHRLREQQLGISDAPAQSVRRTQGCSQQGEIARLIRFPTDAHSAFEQRERSAEVPLAQGQQTEPL